MACDSAQSGSRPVDPAGTHLHAGRHGPQRVRSRGKRWSEAAEKRFLDHLAATANVMASAEACGFTPQAVYARRRRDAAFQQRWDAALAQGYAHIEALLVQRAIEALAGFEPDPVTPIAIRDMTLKDAMILLGHHRRTMEGRSRDRRKPWQRREPPIEQVREEILRKVEAIERVKRAKIARDWAAARTGQPHGNAGATRNLVAAYRGQDAPPGAG